jgi:predicted ATP-grasp superfamily ATP-dependent carboligase
LILGASTRAAAFSALRCGVRPHCADYFADRDLAAVCPVVRVDPAHAARDFIAWAESLPPSPWFYTGGVENRPRLVERICRRHRLWGVNAATLRAVRNPIRVAGALDEAGIPCPAVSLEAEGLPRDGSWLVKPLASGGGRSIEPLTRVNIPGSQSNYFQERIDGPSFSALFMAQGSRSRLVGITRQLIGTAGCPFAYCGSVGPCPITALLDSRLRALGDRLTAAFALVGWFGVDYVLHAGIPWPVEVNPRYPASLEIHELATGQSLMDEHRRTCEGGSDQTIGPARLFDQRSPMVAKEILYAPRHLVAPAIIADDHETHNVFAIRSIADVPWPGTCFDAADPVMTLFATGEDLGSCRWRLTRLKRVWMRRLGLN